MFPTENLQNTSCPISFSRSFFLGLYETGSSLTTLHTVTDQLSLAAAAGPFDHKQYGGCWTSRGGPQTSNDCGSVSTWFPCTKASHMGLSSDKTPDCYSQFSGRSMWGEGPLSGTVPPRPWVPLGALLARPSIRHGSGPTASDTDVRLRTSSNVLHKSRICTNAKNI